MASFETQVLGLLFILMIVAPIGAGLAKYRGYSFFFSVIAIVFIGFLATGVASAVMGGGGDNIAKGSGAIGAVVMLAAPFVLPNRRRPCPHCRSRIHRRAAVCPRCHRDLVSA